ncbi:MAG TPA: iron export ABC transporter permease subunit FetB [Oscillatoriaceae cyanobacterium M33_DOE_052]|uniref:Iron export ABC transporter permease subunit FetB n=1 Tax=Planktothricoides sp. SpSt-374 TaxID=2282167 RepID=A0A7C3ZHL4_9CYAN|nr:iron export ABC transporter permease subunit FetB [Oscillatoriaceae cyanobacterium M33_DOE_052]
MIELDFIDLGLALGMMVIAVGVSWWQGLGLEGQLAMATVRTVVQLLVVGSLLEVVFQWRHPAAVLAVVMVMLTIAAVVARNRIGKEIPGVLLMVWGSILTALSLTMAYVNLLVLRSPEALYSPQYMIPLTGIVLGNGMNAAAIAGERLATTIKNSKQEIETHLCLGATPEQAVKQYRRDAIKAGMIPTLNAMMVVGIVTLPGIITGQMLTGVNPLNAAAYQILIMFMLALTTLITGLLVTWGLCQQFFNRYAQLREF